MAVARLLPRRLFSLVKLANAARPLSTSQSSSSQVAEESWLKTNWTKFSNVVETLERKLFNHKREISDEQIAEREAFWWKIRGLAYLKPPQEPGVDLYIEGFELFIKYDDKIAVEALMSMVEKENFVLGDKAEDLIEDYLLKVSKRGLYEDY